MFGTSEMTRGKGQIEFTHIKRKDGIDQKTAAGRQCTRTSLKIKNVSKTQKIYEDL